MKLPPRYKPSGKAFDDAGMSEAIVCTDTHLERQVVIKSLKPGADSKRILEGKVLPLASSQGQFKTTTEEVFEVIKKCLLVDASKRLSADELVQACEKLCYPITDREFGVVSKFDNNSWGFIQPEHGKSIFFHVESVFGKTRLKVGDRVSFARHAGGGSDRAFPVIKVA